VVFPLSDWHGTTLLNIKLRDADDYSPSRHLNCYQLKNQ
jgi:hypothetical protein